MKHLALIAFLADLLGVKKGQVILLDGATGRRKRIFVQGVDAHAAGVVIQ